MKDKDFEKAERLRECADVSFEEARDALKACGGDMLEAMVYLERMGHAKKNVPLREDFDFKDDKTGKSEKNRKECKTKIEVPQPKKEGPSFLQKLGHLLGTLIRKSMENYLVVSYEGVVKFRISLFVFVILFMFFSFGLIIAMGVSLFFGVKYSFAGRADLSGVNRVMENAGSRAEQWWSGYRCSPEVDNLCRKYDDDQNSYK